MPLSTTIDPIQRAIWDGCLPLSIRLSATESRTYDQTDPYLISYPRLSYLPFLLPRLKAFFATYLIDPDNVASHEGWFSVEGVPLRWHYPLGLLYDLFSGYDPAGGKGGGNEKGVETRQGPVVAARLPWEIEVHFTDWPDEQLVRLDAEGRVMHDAFINSVKEADFIRNGTAKGIMSLSKEDSTRLWTAVQDHDLSLYNSINQKLLNPLGAGLRHVPIRVYLPSSPPTDADTNTTPGTLRVVQSLVAPSTGGREPQTLGTALYHLLPSLFPKRGAAAFARAVLHGAAVPLNAPVEDMMRTAAYADGWIHLSVVMIG